MALFRSDTFCVTLIAGGTGGIGDDVETAKDSKDGNSAGKNSVGPIPVGFATAPPPIDIASTPRHHPKINLFGSITVLAGEASGYGKESDRTDARVSRHVSLQALDNLSRCAPTIQ
jgi:hypothetical protein